MSVINNTTYFLGPLYTNQIFSNSTINIKNDISCVGIITTNFTCYRLYTDNVNLIGNNININSFKYNVFYLDNAINYYTNVSSLVNITSGDMGIIRNNNISNTLGYTFNVNRNEASTNTDAYFPFLGTYTIVPNTKQILDVSVIGSIKVRSPGMYLLYVTVGIWSTAENYTTSYTLNNFNTEIKINGISALFINEMTNILNYKNSLTEYSNVLYFYNKVIMCNVTSENSIISIEYRPGVSGTMSFDMNGIIDTTFNFSRLLRYNIIKIS